MIKSKYFNFLIFSLPGAYLALWLSRISLEIINLHPHYYGNLFLLMALAIGGSIGILFGEQFRGLSWENYFLIAFSLFFLDEIPPLLKMIFWGLTVGVILHISLRTQRKYLMGGIVLGGAISFFIGAEFFVIYSLMGLAIGVILLGYSIFSLKNRHYKTLSFIISFLLFCIFSTQLYSEYQEDMKLKKNNELITNTPLGKTKLVYSEDEESLKIYDHKNNIIDYNENYFANNSMILPVLLQKNSANLDVLYIGYVPNVSSILPLSLYNSEFVNRVDILSWGGILRKDNSFFYRYPGSAIIFAKNKKYDIIFIENLPTEDYISKRIFLRYVRKNLKDNQSILVYPESLMAISDGRYIKPFEENNLVFLANDITSENREELSKRYFDLLELNTDDQALKNIYQKHLNDLLPEKFTSPNPTNGNIISANMIKIPLKDNMILIIAIVVMVLYLIFRTFSSRHRDNSYRFYSFENGYIFTITSVCVIFMLSEYRLVFWFYSPALITILGLLMINYRSKLFEFICNLSMGWVFAYLLVPLFILILQPFYFLLPFWILSIIANGNAIKKIKIHGQFKHKNSVAVYTIFGVLLALTLSLFALNPIIYKLLIYIALLFRIMYSLKI